MKLSCLQWLLLISSGKKKCDLQSRPVSDQELLIAVEWIKDASRKDFKWDDNNNEQQEEEDEKIN